jgi:hypothetical protein
MIVKALSNGMQAQRAGKKPPDGDTTFETVWKWKHPAFERICPTYTSRLKPGDLHAMHLDHYAGYFQAGSVFLVPCMPLNVHHSTGPDATSLGLHLHELIYGTCMTECSSTSC